MQENGTLPPFGLYLHCVVPPENGSAQTPLWIDFDPSDERCRPWLPLHQAILAVAKSMGMDVRPYEAESDTRWVHLVLIAPSCLSAPAFFDAFPDCPLRGRVRPTERFMGQAPGRFNPILSISQEDFTEIFTAPSPQRNSLLHSLRLDPRAKFLDASIWHRYVPELPDGDETFEGLLRDTLAELCAYWDHGLYYTVPAVSTLDFQLRMLRQSYIGPFGEGGHSEVVTPFKFHSERHLKKRVEQSEARFFLDVWDKTTLAETLCWRVLAVDDNADEVFSTIDNARYQHRVNVKKQVLLRKPIDDLYRKVVQQQAESEDCPKDFDPTAALAALEKKFEVVCPETKKGIVDHCLQALQKQTYDILFLDYLLGERPNGAEREYGHEFLLELIHRKEDPALRRDFMGRHWIFPISSFPFALPDKLIQLGIGHSLPLWRLSVGGDPVTTPHLYAYYLLRFMKARVAEHFLYPKAMGRLFSTAPHFWEDQQGKQWAGLLDHALMTHNTQIKVITSGQKDKYDSRFLDSLKDFPAFGQASEIIQLVRKILIKVAAVHGTPNYKKIQSHLEDLRKKGGSRYEGVIEKFAQKIAGYTTELGQEEARKKIGEAFDHKRTTLILDNLNLSYLPDEIARLSGHLQILSLENNRLENWDSLHILRQFTRLKQLNLTNNPAEVFQYALREGEVQDFLRKLP